MGTYRICLWIGELVKGHRRLKADKSYRTVPIFLWLSSRAWALPWFGGCSRGGWKVQGPIVCWGGGRATSNGGVLNRAQAFFHLVSEQIVCRPSARARFWYSAVSCNWYGWHPWMGGRVRDKRNTATVRPDTSAHSTQPAQPEGKGDEDTQYDTWNCPVCNSSYGGACLATSRKPWLSKRLCEIHANEVRQQHH